MGNNLFFQQRNLVFIFSLMTSIALSKDVYVFMMEQTKFAAGITPQARLETIITDQNFKFESAKILPFESISYDESEPFNKRYKIQLSDSPFNLVDQTASGTVKYQMLNFRFLATGKRSSDALTFYYFGKNLFTTILMDSIQLDENDNPIPSTRKTKIINTSIIQNNDTVMGVKNKGAPPFRFAAPIFTYCFDPANKFSPTTEQKLVAIFDEFQNYAKKMKITLRFAGVTIGNNCTCLLSNKGRTPESEPSLRGSTQRKLVNLPNQTGLSLWSKIDLYTAEPKGKIYPDNNVAITLRHELLHALGFEHVEDKTFSIMEFAHNFELPQQKDFNAKFLTNFDLEMFKIAYRDFY